MDIAGSSVLITGASGFIGRPLSAALIRRGARVAGVSREIRASDPALPVEWHRADLGSPDEVQRLMAAVRPDFVVHLSSLAHGGRELNLVAPTLQAELVPAVHVLTAAAEQGIRRMVLPGSLEEPDRGEVASSPYAAAKAATRIYADLFRQLYSLPVVHTRIFMAYGPGQPDWKLIPSVIAALLRRDSPTVNSPDRPVDWIYVSDVVEGLLAVLAAPVIDGRTVDIGSGVLTPVREVVLRLQALIAPDVTVTFAPGAARAREQVRKADLPLTTQLLGWRPVVSLAEGLAQTVESARIMSMGTHS